jgi:hypothetical protein
MEAFRKLNVEADRVLLKEAKLRTTVRRKHVRGS